MINLVMPYFSRGDTVSYFDSSLSVVVGVTEVPLKPVTLSLGIMYLDVF